MQLKNGVAVALLGVLAACGPSVRGPAPGAVPVNVEAAAAKFYAENPGSAAGLVDDRQRGFLINEDGKAFFIPFNAKSDLRNRTGVSSMEGNQICFRPGENGWSGACIFLFLNPDGSYFIEGKFGNGATIRETLNLVVLPAV